MGNVQIWLAGAAAGKSARIAAALADQVQENPLGGPLWWVVPGDASYAAERQLLARVVSSLRAAVVSVPRLAELANREVRAVPGTPLQQTGKRLLLAAVYRECRDSLLVLHRDRLTVPFLDALLAGFAELTCSAVPWTSVEAALETAAASVRATPGRATAASGRSLVGKLRDLCQLYVVWQQRLAERQVYDPEELPLRLLPHVASWPALQGARLYIDGLTQLPPRDLVFLLALAAVAEQTVFALPADPRWWQAGHGTGHGTALQQPERTPAGRPTGWLLQRLEQVSESAAVYAPQALWLVEQIQAHAAACGLQVEVRTLPDTERPALVRAVEAAVFAGPLPPPPPAEPPVTLATAQNIRAEAEGVARAIARHVRELGWRYRDVAVLVPSLADYAGPLRDSFERHGLPVCLEDFPLLSSHPLAKFLLAAMVSAEDQASTAAMASLLKTSFCQLAEADADWLELYLRRYEVAGIDTWTQAAAWTFAQEEADPAYLADAVAADARADGLRRQVAAVLASFWAAVAAAELTPRALGESLWALLQAAAVKQRVAGWMLAATEAQRPAEATLHEQAWQRILALLDDLTETWPEALLRRSFLFELVQDDLTHQPLVTIPAGVDEVLVTEVSRARGLRVRGLWVMGAADGQLPPRVHTDGLLHDEERLLFARLFGQPLGLTGEDVQLCQRETVYLALTRASERLCVSYPLVAADGRATQPARAWERLRSHLPPGWFSSEGWRDHPGDLQPGAWSPPAALSALVHSVAATRAGAPLPATALAVFDWFAHQPAAHAALRQALAGIGQRAKARPLSAAVAQRLFGDPLHVHVHQLESFAACPFQHFARYGLRASEEVLPKADRAARGTLLHAAVQAFVQTQAADVAAWRQLTDEAAAAAARQVYTQLLHDPRTAFWRRRRSRWQQAQADLAVVEKVAVALTRQVRWGRYEPLATEVAFGSGHSAWPPLVRRLADGGTLQLRGRIDRVDVVRDGGQAVFRVIDYKSSLALKWDQSKLEHGLQLQLPLYAVALWATAERWLQQPAEPAGIFYIPTGRSLARVLIPEAATAARARALRQLRARGALAAVQAWVGWLDERLLAGGETELFARVFNQNGQWSQRSPALPPEVWRGMLRRALQHAEAIGQAIRRGDNRIAPYQLGQETACQHCRLQAVCHLERRWDRSPLRRLQRLDGAELAAAWHALGTDWAGPQADGTPMTAPLREDGAAAAADGPARGGHHDGRDVV